MKLHALRLLIVICAFLGIAGFHYLITNEYFIYILEKEQVSIWYVRDIGLTASVGIIIILFIMLILEKIKFIPNLKETATYYFILMFLTIAMASKGIISMNYGNVPISETGAFYILPKGEVIDYPRNKREQHNKSVKQTG